MENINWTGLVFAVIGVVVFIASLWAAGAISSANMLKNIKELTEVINLSVEKADTFDHMTDAQKYDYVAEFTSTTARDRGIDVSPELMRQLIEGAVKLVHRREADRVG